MSTGHRQRWRYFLKDGSQLQLILKTYFILSSIILIAGAIFYFIGNQSLTAEFYAAHSVIKTTMELLLPGLLLVNAAGLLGAFVFILFFTHSIAGPIYQLNMLSEKIENGDLTVSLRFRKGDAIPELAEIFNKIIRGLNSRVRGFSAPVEKLKRLKTRISKAEDLSRQELSAIKHEIASISSELEERLQQFQLVDKK